MSENLFIKLKVVNHKIRNFCNISNIQFSRNNLINVNFQIVGEKIINYYKKYFK